MNSLSVKKNFNTNEAKIAFRLSGKIKNFTGRGPGVIKVQIKENLVTVQLKWFLTVIEKNFLAKCDDSSLVSKMQADLLELARRNLFQALTEVFNNDIRIIEVQEELLQEKMSIKAQVVHFAMRKEAI